MSGGGQFIPGRLLSRALFEEMVEPVVARSYPRLRFAAALIGPGSDVLGFDTARSTDHDWGPRCSLILAADDEREVGDRLRQTLTDALPLEFRGYPVMFQPAPGEPQVAVPAKPERDASVFHRVEVVTLGRMMARLDYQPGDKDDPGFWLTVSDQQLLECTSGAVFRDDDGDVCRFRETLAFYPDDVWRYRMAALWKRVSQIEPFVGRTGEVGDEIGSYVLGARLVEDIMRLALSQARQYAPYSKWLGTAFSRLDIARELHVHVDRSRKAMTWREREAGVVAALSVLVREHNRLGLTPEIDSAPRSFHNRPFTVIGAERVSDALGESLQESALSGLPIGLGGIDQFMDSTDALGDRWLRRALRNAMREQVADR